MGRKARIEVAGLRLDNGKVYLYPNPVENIEYWRKQLIEEGFEDISVIVHVLDKEDYNTDGFYPIRLFREDEDTEMTITDEDGNTTLFVGGL